MTRTLYQGIEGGVYTVEDERKQEFALKLEFKDAVKTKLATEVTFEY